MGTLVISVITLILCSIPANAVKKGQLHSLPQHMLEVVFPFDKLVGEALKQLCSPTERVLRYLDSYERLVKDAAAFNIDTVSTTFIGNPLHTYAVIKRLVLYWPEAREVLFKHTKLKDHTDRIKEAEEWSVLPSMEDLEGSADSLAYLQHFYDLSIPYLVSGRIMNNFTSIELDVWDCLRLAQVALKNKRYVSAWQWYDHVRSTTKDIGMKDHVQEELKVVIKQHDESWQNTENYFASPLSKKPIQSPRKSDVMKYCRGAYEILHNGECRMTTKGSPYFILGPVKEETISRDPDINLYHAILSENEIEHLKLLTQGKLEKDLKQRRKSWQALLSVASHPLVYSVSQRASYLTGLSTYDSPGGMEEKIKIRNYGTGGYISEHVDVRCRHTGICPPPDEKEAFFVSGDRLSTTLFYLNDVEAGGRTAFYFRGLSIAPAKGTAIVWLNLLKNGSYDRRVDHAGCPVILGTKWVAVKWIRENENFLLHPCSLNSEE